MFSLNYIKNNFYYGVSQSVNQREEEDFETNTVRKLEIFDPANTIEGLSPFDETQGMPQFVVLHILSFLDIDDLGNSGLVSKSWKQLASDDILWKDLQRFFPSLKAIDESAWEKHVDLKKWELSFDNLVPLDNKMLIPELKKFASLPIEDNAGFTLLTLPKGLSFNKLVEIAGSPKQENASLFAFIGVNFEDQLGDQATDTSCTVLISNSILENSRSKTLANHQEIVGQYKCEMPGVLDAATVVVLTQRIDGKPLFTERIYTRCSDKINGRGMVVVGFGSFGLDVTYDYGRDSDGVAALRKF